MAVSASSLKEVLTQKLEATEVVRASGPYFLSCDAVWFWFSGLVICTNIKRLNGDFPLVDPKARKAGFLSFQGLMTQLICV